MDIDLPDYGCVIANSATQIRHYYNPNNHASSAYTRQDVYYYIDGKLVYNGYSTQASGYNLNTLNCLHDGDLVYKPELQVYFPILSFMLVCCILLFIYHVFIKRLLP